LRAYESLAAGVQNLDEMITHVSICDHGVVIGDLPDITAI